MIFDLISFPEIGTEQQQYRKQLQTSEKHQKGEQPFGCIRQFTPREGRATRAAVSYTHLDVYKRQTQFYTHLYRSFIHPNVCSDVNGEYTVSYTHLQENNVCYKNIILFYFFKKLV